MSIVEYDGAAVAEIATYLDMRKPNAAALDKIAQALNEREPGAEIVADLATGVGKTYIAGGLLDYLYEQGVRNVVIITPGSTIQRKTIANLTPGNRKYLQGLKCEPEVITLDDLERGAVAQALDNPDQMKVVVLTVQSLLRPNTKDNRRAYLEHETLSISLSDYLKGVDDLVVIADEHHIYFNKTAKQFRKAIEGLHPAALIGLTATPHSSTGPANIVYQYPLAEAIADGFVKIPVLVARQDRKSDLRTQMADGVSLLHAKENAMRLYCQDTGRQKDYVQPVMFVVASSIDEANQIATMLAGSDYLGSPDSVLLVTSEEPDTITKQLDELEHPDSPIRAVVSVQMLGIGWDVKNVYVVAAVRALESELLTEQILGRGLRLPFGRRTGIPMLDTVEVLSHHAFAELLKQAKVLLAQTLGDRAEEATGNASVTDGVRGQDVNLDQPELPTPVVDDPNVTISVSLPGRAGAADQGPDLFNQDTWDEDADDTADHQVIGLSTVDARLTEGERTKETLATPLKPRTPNGTHLPLHLPKVTYKTVRPVFSLATIDLNAVEARGAMFANDNAPTLQRKVVNAHRDDSGDIAVTISDAQDAVVAATLPIPFNEIESDLVGRLLRTNAFPQSTTELNAAIEIARAFLKGAQVTNETPWRPEHGRLATESLANYLAQKESELDVKIVAEVALTRWPDPPEVTQGQPPADRQQITHSHDFQRSYPYTGWNKSFYPVVAFDSYSAEFRLAERLEASPNVKAWQRINWNVPLAITYRFNDGNKTYIPDFIVVEDDGTTEGRYWIVEGKANKDLMDPIVIAKREAAKRWVDAVNASADVPTKWGYLLAS